MNATDREVIVVGGGISGLTAAWRLKQAGVSVRLLERALRVGGCTTTERRDGFLLEKGPFNVMVRDPSFEALLGELSDEVAVVSASPAARRRYIYRGGRLQTVPSNPLTLLTTGLLSVGGKCRLLSGLLWSRRAEGVEETIEQAAVRRFGREAADRIVSATIAGIFAGDIRKLSLSACFPSVGRVDAEARSLIGFGLRAAFRKKGSGHRRRWRGLVSIDGGLGAVCESLARRLGGDLQVNASVRAIRPTGDGYDIECESATGEASLSSEQSDGAPRTLKCRHLVIASPAAETGRLLVPLAPQAAAELGAIESASLAVLNLGFRSRDVGHPLDGFGFLVPHDERDFPLMGVLWADSVFPHHAPPDHRLVRVFVGGPRDPQAVDRSDDELVATALGALRGVLRLGGDPVLTDVSRYSGAIPQYHVGHMERIARVRRAVAARPGLHLVGNYLEGVSLNDCVRLATRVAGELIRTATVRERPDAQPNELPMPAPECAGAGMS